MRKVNVSAGESSQWGAVVFLVATGLGIVAALLTMGVL